MRQGRVKATIDANNNNKTTSHSYDAAGNRTVKIDPLANCATTVYNAASQVVQSIDANDHTTSYSHVAAGRQIMVQDTSGTSTPQANRTTTV